MINVPVKDFEPIFVFVKASELMMLNKQLWTMLINYYVCWIVPWKLDL